MPPAVVTHGASVLVDTPTAAKDGEQYTVQSAGS